MIIYGCGGHGKVIAEACLADEGSISFFMDDAPKVEHLLDIEVKKFSEELLEHQNMVLAFGNNELRKNKYLEFKDKIAAFTTIIHPLAFISPTANVEEGTVVLLKSVINTSSKVGKHCIINTGAIVDHDCKIGDFTHIAPNATLCGHVEVGELCLVGSGVTITPGVKIGSNVKIAAGLTVSKDIPDNQTIFTNHV